MFKRLLLISILTIFSANAQVLSGHQEFVHYSNEQKEEFIMKIMELMVELEQKYETAPASEKAKYSIQLHKLKNIFISSAYAAEVDLSSFANDLTSLLDPNVQADNRCIYAGWISRTVPVMDHISGRKEVCQHPKYIRNGANSAEARAYEKSSNCGKQNRNSISCNPAIFGFKNQDEGSQFCVPAGAAHSENSSYACMQLAIGVKNEKGADPAEKRIDYLKKQFEGNPALVNNLYGFIYKTCLCETQESPVINEIYLSNTRPHRTCLGLINSIAETNHCVEFNTAKSTDMELFKGIRSFTNDLAGQMSGAEVDNKYRELLGSLKTRFSSDYAQICGEQRTTLPEPQGEAKDCIGECDLVDGKFQNCIFKIGEKTLEIKPPEDGSREFTHSFNEENYLCKISEKTFDHQTTCKLVAEGDEASFQLSHPEDMKPEVKATHWSPSQGEGILNKVAFKDVKELSLKIDIVINGKTASIDCNSLKNPKDNTPEIKLILTDETKTHQNFDTETTPENVDGWKYVWTRSKSSTVKEDQPEIQIHGDSVDEEEAPKEEAPKEESTTLDNDAKTYSAPKEAESYKVCVQLTKEEKKSNIACEDVSIKGEEEITTPTNKPNVGGPQLPPRPNQMRRGVDFSRGGIL